MTQETPDQREKLGSLQGHLLSITMHWEVSCDKQAKAPRGLGPKHLEKGDMSSTSPTPSIWPESLPPR